MAGAVELFYESLGEGTPLVLQAHDHTPWLFAQAPAFSQRYRFLTYDRRGTGRSASPPGDWTPADLANDLAALLDALGIERAIVGGSSLGGVVTAQFAVDHPGRALALIIGHTVPYLDPEGRAWLEAEMKTARSGGAAIVRQPRSGAHEKEGPPTTDPAFAASDWGRMIAATGTGLGRTPEERARAIAMLREMGSAPAQGRPREDRRADARDRRREGAAHNDRGLARVGLVDPGRRVRHPARRASRRAARGRSGLERGRPVVPRSERPRLRPHLPSPPDRARLPAGRAGCGTEAQA
jgi:pimeloyl-ACP methyl ester carboxylesterase